MVWLALSFYGQDLYKTHSVRHTRHTFTSCGVRTQAGEKDLKLFTLSGSCYVLECADISEDGLESTREVLAGWA